MMITFLDEVMDTSIMNDNHEHDDDLDLIIIIKTMMAMMIINNMMAIWQ